MEPDGDDFRFTEDGWAQREELVGAAEAHLRRLEPRLPERIEISRAARKTLARHLAGDKEVTDANRDAYRELARAGIMESEGTFIRGDDCVFQFTHQGWERRHEFQRPSPRFSASAIARWKESAPRASGVRIRTAMPMIRDAQILYSLGDNQVENFGISFREIPGVRRRIVPHRPGRWRRAGHGRRPEVASELAGHRSHVRKETAD